MDRCRIGRLIAAGALLAIGGCGATRAPADEPGLIGGWRTAGCALAGVPERAGVAGVRVPATFPPPDAAITRIDQGGRDEFAESYAGIELDQHRGRAVVYRVPSAAFDEFIRRGAENACVVVRDAAHSTSDLRTWHDRVLADLPFWRHRGIGIVSIGARHDGAGVEVGTREVERARRELPARYGSRAPLIFVAEGPVRPQPRPSLPTVIPPGG